MLVTFSCDSHVNITMFGDVAVHFLKMMGLSERVPGRLRAESVKDALVRLKRGVAEEQEVADAVESEGDVDDDDGEEVSVLTRALPLIDLLTSAAAHGDDVMWEKRGW
ncbi:MAG: DUF1840 domain-containing protein [Gammaproteobacteria bacterium]|jgi:hypothetical protein|nr:DUF1840 domain-containing protein [Gammaproteobacteria bacterium]